MDANDEIHDDLSAGYDLWITLFRNGLTEMHRRGDLLPEADPRHLAVSLIAAHQGGATLTYATGKPEAMRAALNAAVDYVRSFADERMGPALAPGAHAADAASWQRSGAM